MLICPPLTPGGGCGRRTDPHDLESSVYRSRMRWRLAAVVTLARAVCGFAEYALQSGKDLGEALGIEPHGGEGEGAKPDPNANGSGPEAFTVPGHSVFIDVRHIHS